MSDQTTYERVAVIVNPASGRAEPVLSRLNQVLGRRGVEWRVFVTSGKSELSDLIDQSHDWRPDLVAVYGGDGTISQAAAALSHRGLPMAILPGGTANVMAKTLSIPDDLVRAIELPFGNHLRRRIDLGQSQSSTFILRMGIGFEAAMIRGADQALKAQVGSLAYFVSAIRAMGEPQVAEYHITVDDESFQFEALTCLIANSMNLGLTDLELSPSIRVDDGLLDLVVIRRVDLSILSDLAGTLRGDPPFEGSLMHWQGRRLEVRATPAQEVERDGEPAGSTPIRAEVIPDALEVITPADNAVRASLGRAAAAHE